jgi:hypothetical protein
VVVRAGGPRQDESDWFVVHLHRGCTVQMALYRNALAALSVLTFHQLLRVCASGRSADGSRGYQGCQAACLCAVQQLAQAEPLLPAMQCHMVWLQGPQAAFPGKSLQHRSVLSSVALSPTLPACCVCCRWSRQDPGNIWVGVFFHCRNCQTHQPIPWTEGPPPVRDVDNHGQRWLLATSWPGSATGGLLMAWL